MSGTGAPATGLGVNGDFYIDTAASKVYGPKAAGVWGAGVSMIGPQGATGAQGPTGAAGAQGPIGSTGPAGAQGPIGSTGATGAAGSKWFGWYLNVGETPPTGTGVNSDWFLNTRNGDIYGPKQGGSWGNAAGNIQGAAGVAGVAGADGSKWLSWFSNGAPASSVGANNDFFLDTATGDVWGPKANGAWPSTAAGNIKGPAGPQGATGAQGATGSTGPAGTAGSKWFSAAGAPAVGTGVAGDFYLNTTTGDVYGPKTTVWGSVVGNIKGATGATGTTGAAGAAGAAGSKWYSGETAPAAGTGVAGDYYLNTETGDIYGPKTTVWGSISGNIASPSRVFVQQTRPTQTGPWMWWKTDATGNLLDLIVNTGV